MTKVLVAEFDHAELLIGAVRKLVDEGRPPLDALMPYHVPEVSESLSGGRGPAIRPVMAAAGLGMAAVAIALQWFSATTAYPIDSGDRSLNSWHVFLLSPLEVGVLAVAIAVLVAVLVGCGLPQIHRALLAYPRVERVTQDRFFILVSRGPSDEEDEALRRSLFACGAIAIGACET